MRQAEAEANDGILAGTAVGTLNHRRRSGSRLGEVGIPLIGLACAVVIFVPLGALTMLESRTRARAGVLSGASR